LLVAAMTLNASPLEMSLLHVADMAPALLVGLFAGVWVDRLRRRPIMIWADLGRFLLTLSVPVAALLGALRIEQLYLVALLVGVLATFFDVAYRSYLPSLVRREALVEANARLQATNAVAEVAGFGLAGGLVQLLTAPVAVAVDGFSFLVSAVSLALIGRQEPPAPAETQAGAWAEIREGLAVLWRDPVLRAFALAGGTRAFFVYIWVALLLLFLTRELGLSPFEMGLLFAIGGVSSFFGALIVEPITRRFGIGPTLIAAFFLYTASLTLVPLAAGPHWLVLLLVGLPQCLDAGYVLYEVNETSVVQAVAPERALGRVNASLRLVAWGSMLAGSLAGGVLGQTIGLRWAMLIGAIAALVSVVWLLLSPIRKMRELPAPAMAAPLSAG
ncbi:MAG TPA: MFS transporter, partial [Chloroflexota bacterium]